MIRSASNPPSHDMLGFVLPLLALLAIGGLGVWRERTAVMDEQARRLAWLANTAAGSANESLDRHRNAWAWAEVRIDRNGTRSGPGWIPEAPFPQSEGEAAKLLAGGHLDAVIERHPAELSPAGIPLGPVAAYRKVLAAPDTGAAVDAARQLRELAFAYPSLLTPRLLDGADAHLRKMGVSDPTAPPWRERWEAIEKLSPVLAELPDGPLVPAPPRIVQSGGDHWCLEIRPQGNGCVVRAFPLAAWICETRDDWAKLPAGNGIRLSPAADGLGLGGARPAPEHWPHAAAATRGGTIQVIASADPEILARAVRLRAGLLLGTGLLAGAVMALAWVRQRRALRMQTDLARQKDDFLSTVSHELRTPVAAIQLLSENLATGTVTDAAGMAQYHRRLLLESKRLAATTAQLLDFALMERGHKTYQFRPLDPRTLAAEVGSALSPLAAERGIALDIEADPGISAAAGDSVAIRRLILNLADNAIKYSPSGTRVSIRIKPAETRSWMIQVTDQGPGIPADEQARIFDRFFRGGSVLNRGTRGTGIGLAVARHVADGHGGTLMLTETSPAGSTFTCVLPNQPPDADVFHENPAN